MSDYAQGNRVHQIWDAVWELADADKMNSGFSLLVNDADQGNDRDTLRFGQGISSPHDPRRFAILNIIEQGATSGTIR